MDNLNQIPQPAAIPPKKDIQALSLIIRTEPKLYWELASNPFSKKALQLASERFPYASAKDVIKAVIFAEPKGEYDSLFKTLEKIQQKEELHKQNEITTIANVRLSHYCKKYEKELSRLTKEFIYDNLFRVVFETDDVKEAEKRYAQNQRQDLKLSIVNFIDSRLKNPHKKTNRKLPLLLGGFVAFSLVLFFYFANGIYSKQVELGPTQNTMQHLRMNKQILGIETRKETQGLPVRLIIPSINVDASIENEGVTSQGAMGVPNTITDVGWFDLGPRPGEKGSAVIAGHFDGEGGQPGVFANLAKLTVGDKLYIKDSNGKSITFVVRAHRTYDPGYADDVFSKNDNTYLNLITCDGIWDTDKKSYSKRLVVFANIAD